VDKKIWGQEVAVFDSIITILPVTHPALPYLTFGVGRLLHLPSAEAVSVRPNAQPRCNQKVTGLWSRTNHQPPGTGVV